MEVAESPAEAPSRFERGEPVTFVVSATADAEYEACAPGGTTIPMLEAKLPARTMTRMAVPCDAYPGVRVIHGDVMPTLIQALRDAMQYRDCGEGECAGWHEQYERLLDALGAAET